MEIYDSLLKAVHDEYDTLRVLKKSAWGEVSLVRHRESGTRYIFRHFEGSSEVYQLLLGLSCRNLPQIMEVGEKDGRTALLEEYVQGDTLGEILEGGVLTTGQAKQIGRQLCSALWVLHSRGIVHRDVKPDNVILRGSEAVLIDFDASRIHKTAISEDTKILGTTGFALPGSPKPDDRDCPVVSWNSHPVGCSSPPEAGSALDFLFLFYGQVRQKEPPASY